MTTIPVPGGDWTSDDRDNLRAFFSTPTGQKLIPTLANSVPPLLSGGETNSLLVRMGEVRGSGARLEQLWLLAYPLPEVEQPANPEYPSLVDDEAWADGQTTKPTA